LTNPFIPELSVSSNFGFDGANMIKPIMRRNCLHQRNNIIIQWKSFEIWMVKLEYSASADGATNSMTG